MTQGGVEDHDVEGPVLELERPGVSLDELHVARRVVPAGAGQEGGGGVEADDLGDARPAGQLPGDRTGAAADFQHPGPRGEPDVAQVGLAHGRLLRVGGPQLEHLGELGHQRRLGIGDHGVDIGHRSAPPGLARTGRP
jgi:hypothetical protein